MHNSYHPLRCRLALQFRSSPGLLHPVIGYLDLTLLSRQPVVPNANKTTQKSTLWVTKFRVKRPWGPGQMPILLNLYPSTPLEFYEGILVIFMSISCHAHGSGLEMC